MLKVDDQVWQEWDIGDTGMLWDMLWDMLWGILRGMLWYMLWDMLRNTLRYIARHHDTSDTLWFCIIAHFMSVSFIMLKNRCRFIYIELCEEDKSMWFVCDVSSMIW